MQSSKIFSIINIPEVGVSLSFFAFMVARYSLQFLLQCPSLLINTVQPCDTTQARSYLDFGIKLRFT